MMNGRIRLAEIPKCLLPKIKRAGTVMPITMPAAHQGQGWDSSSINCSCYFNCKVGGVKGRQGVTYVTKEEIFLNLI